MEERRRHRRFEVKGLIGTLAGRHGFTVLTISRGGMLAASSFEPPVGHVFDVDLPLAAEVFRSSARVVFVGEDRGAPRSHRYRFGLAFTVESEEDSRILDGFIRRELEARIETESA
jgi:PilZ domain